MEQKSIIEKPDRDALADTNHVESVIQRAHEELSELLRQRVVLTRRIGAVKQTIVGLIKLFGGEVLGEDIELAGHRVYRRGPGITDSCRKVLMEAGGALSAREVRDHIQQSAPAVLANHKDPLATVTTVLGRLGEYGEARAVISDEGRRAWEWSVESPPIDRQSIDRQSIDRQSSAHERSGLPRQ